jgi:hypothetical protein
MTQRRLEDEAPPAEESDGATTVPESEPDPVEDAPLAPATRPALHLEGPSDVELRKRQDAWSVERTRHEAYRRERRATDLEGGGSQGQG